MKMPSSRLPKKANEYLKISLFTIAVLLIGSVVSIYSEIISGLLLFFGLIAAILSAVRVFRGGNAFD